MARKPERYPALYERLSHDDELQGESNSISNQKRILEDYAEQHGFTNCIHFTDDGISGTQFDRPGFQKMIAEVKADRISVVIMLIVQDAVWGRVTANRSAGKSTRYYADEFHLLLKEEQTAAYSVEIWKRFRKWGGIPTALTQNVKDLLASPEVSNIFENSDFVYMLNQANGDRQILAKQLNISPHQLSYVTHSGEGEGLLFFGNVILPFVDHFPKDLELYRILTTKLNEISEGTQK